MGKLKAIDLKMANFFTDRWIIAALVLYILSIAAWLLNHGVRVTLEDGFYYFKIAQHVAQGSGSTFDGVNLTNGYHPLWLLTLTPLFWLTASPATALTLAVLLQAVLFAMTVGLIYIIARFSLKQSAATVAALLWVLFTYQTALGGLEFSLQAVGVLLSAYLYLGWFARKMPQPAYLYLILGILLSLTILARLDTVFLAGIIGAVMVRREYKQGLSPAGLRRLISLGMPLGLTSLSYPGINLFLFGHVFPVSGAVKQSWSAYLLSQDPLYLQYGWFGAQNLPFAVACPSR